MNRYLTDIQLEQLVRWARGQGETGQQAIASVVIALVSEVRTLRDRESTMRFLMEIEGEV